MPNSDPLFLSESRVEQLLVFDELLPAIEKALIDFSAGRVIQPLRGIVPMPQPGAFFGLMPALFEDVFGAKLVTVVPANAGRGLPTHLASIQLFDSQTGETLAVMDGRIITAWRTAAVSAIATRELSRPNAATLAILGSGVQARTHFLALTRMRSFQEVRVWSRTPEHARKFAGEIGATTVTVEEAVRGADVIVTVTNAAAPIVRGEWVKPGAYVNAVGAVGLKAREVDDVLMRTATVIVESRESAACESAEIVQSGAPVYAELGELLAGKVNKPEAGKTIVFKSLGIGAEDIAAARLVYRKATAK
ncbi:MAG: ornithine cyclodeaminase family protein [Acidobacteriaceae bacterium]|nr:ornithine cyclodeaminase family protein [Acidobacteriaceae bacterium]